MTQFPRSIAHFDVFPARAPALAPGPCRVCHDGGASFRRCCHPRRAAGAYDGTWNVVFATTRGNCSSGYSVPFTVRGSRVSSAGGGRVSGSVNRAGAVAVRVSVGASKASGGGRLAGSERRGLLARHHLRRPLQRHLAGHAELSRVARIALNAPSGSATGNKNGPPDHPTGRSQFQSTRTKRGASTITTWRPSKRASCSTLANSATSALTLSRSLVPISWCAISRPR